MFTGFTYTGDEFCSMPVNGTLLDDPDKLLGPSGAIVQWNKMMGIVLIMSTLSVTIVCLVLSCVERYLDVTNRSATDESTAGLSECDENAFCLEPPDGIGYSCECDPKYFVGRHNGSVCYESGVEIMINITGSSPQAATCQTFISSFQSASKFL